MNVLFSMCSLTRIQIAKSNQIMQYKQLIVCSYCHELFSIKDCNEMKFDEKTHKYTDRCRESQIKIRTIYYNNNIVSVDRSNQLSLIKTFM